MCRLGMMKSISALAMPLPKAGQLCVFNRQILQGPHPLYLVFELCDSL
jgi:hypothetical protein